MYQPQPSAKMSSITSVYIPHIEKKFDAEYVANVFNKNGIAKVSKVYIEPYKNPMKNASNKYNRAYVEIACWHETEAAYGFISKLRNPSVEARIVHRDDNWWAVDINRNPTKFTSNNRVLTIFNIQNQMDDDSSSTLAVGNVDEFDLYMAEIEDDREQWFNNVVKIDAEKTQLLRDIVNKFNEQVLMQQEDASAYAVYIKEMYEQRDLWHSEQYIWDELCI